MAVRKKESTSTVTGSADAKRIASVILEVFAGIKGTQEASEALGLSPNRYYQLEARALQGMIDFLEPRNRGRQRTPEREIEALKEVSARQTREISRLQALVRAARRTQGIPEKKKTAKKAPARKRKPSHRGKKVIAILRKPKDDGAAERAAS
jgi:hypothetical protein